MSGFSLNPEMVRVDIFKESGKYYTTIQLQWDRYFIKRDDNIELIEDTFKRCMKEQYTGKFTDMCAVCLEPYSEQSYPLMMRL